MMMMMWYSVPEKVTDVRVTHSGSNTLSITWDAQADVTLYEIRHWKLGDVITIYVNMTLSSNFTLSGLVHNTQYSFQVVFLRVAAFLCKVSKTIADVKALNWAERHRLAPAKHDFSHNFCKTSAGFTTKSEINACTILCAYKPFTDIYKQYLSSTIQRHLTQAR